MLGVILQAAGAVALVVETLALGIAYYEAASYPLAVETLTRAIELDPDGLYADDAGYYRGLSYLALGENDRAEADFRGIVERHPESEYASLARDALANLGASRPPAVDLSTPERTMACFVAAVLDGDEQRLRRVFTIAVAAGLEAQGWDRALEDYRRTFATAIGSNLELEGFTYRYEGGPERGNVITFYHNRRIGPMAVVREPDGWRIAEH